MTSEEKSKKAHLYQAHLDRVSRSFAYGIQCLDLSMRIPVALSYLICRILDSIEDLNWPDLGTQSKAFEQFNGFLNQAPSLVAVEAWRSSFPNSMPEGERLLLDDAYQVFMDFHQLDIGDQGVIRPAVLSMSAGMHHFMERKTVEGKLQLSSLADVNRYCFFVAGVVGEILTGLVRVRANEVALTQTEADAISVVDACRFGLFLQKINILKDQVSDESEGRQFVPSRSGLTASAAEDAEAALRYLLSLPIKLKAFRFFCASALFIGLASMPAIRISYATKRLTKLPRLETIGLLSRVKLAISDNNRLLNLFRELFNAARFEDGSSTDQIGVGNSSPEIGKLISIYQGSLSTPDLMNVFMPFAVK
jgi:farnesyl-diphosphate farnesyltransferase